LRSALKQLGKGTGDDTEERSGAQSVLGGATQSSKSRRGKRTPGRGSALLACCLPNYLSRNLSKASSSRALRAASRGYCRHRCLPQPGLPLSSPSLKPVSLSSPQLMRPWKGRASPSWAVPGSSLPVLPQFKLYLWASSSKHRLYAQDPSFGLSNIAI